MHVKVPCHSAGSVGTWWRAKSGEKSTFLIVLLALLLLLRDDPPALKKLELMSSSVRSGLGVWSQKKRLTFEKLRDILAL